MKRIIAIAVFAAFAGACATSGEIQQGAYEHMQRAQIAESHGDYYPAEHERAAASKQYAKAQRRAYDEAYWGYGPYYW
jgi:hypothetical protein